MKKLLVFLAFAFSALLYTSSLVFAEVNATNTMKLGEISSNLPVAEMRSFYSKMEPLMLKIFGPPYSNVNLKIETDLGGTVHDTGYIDNQQTLLLAGQAKEYQKNKGSDSQHALRQIYGNMLHELSHGMFYYGNKRVSFNPQWINEGWAKLLEILLAKDLKMYSFGINPYFNYYLDKDTIAGTPNWGSSKQPTNHMLVYDVTSVVHLTLLSALSSSNTNLDFYRTFNNYIYDWVRSHNETNISFEQYQQLMAKLLAGKTIDGQSAYDWYFSNPDTWIKGNMGNHLGITVDGNEIVAYAFDRTYDGRDIKEKGLQGVDISIKVTNYDGSRLLEKTVATDADGNVRMELPANKQYTLMTLEAQATILGKLFTANTFYFYAPANDKKLTGILMEETGKPLPAKYIGLLKSTNDLPFEYKDRGVFVMDVPLDTRTVTLDFMGHTQDVTKGPFARMYALKVPENYVAEAARLPESAYEKGRINNLDNPIIQAKNLITANKKNFTIGLASLAAVGIVLIFIKKYWK